MSILAKSLRLQKEAIDVKFNVWHLVRSGQFKFESLSKLFKFDLMADGRFMLGWSLMESNLYASA